MVMVPCIQNKTREIICMQTSARKVCVLTLFDEWTLFVGMGGGGALGVILNFDSILSMKIL